MFDMPVNKESETEMSNYFQSFQLSDTNSFWFSFFFFSRKDDEFSLEAKIALNLSTWTIRRNISNTWIYSNTKSFNKLLITLLQILQ